jgi:histidyl-tRNA synthetase
MVGKLLGRDVPACGFSIGFERLILILADRAGAATPGATAAPAAPRRLALVVDGHADLPSALAAARRLRGEGYLVSVELRRKNFGKQLDDFARHGFWGFAAPEASGAVTVKPLTGPPERR